MKKFFIITLCIYFIAPGKLLALRGRDTVSKDTLKIECVLSSAKLFYGIELGEKPLRDIVDTLVGEISFYDSASQLNLIILSGRDLGFKNETDILWSEILDSAIKRGYEICPPQTGPDLYVISKNMPRGRTLIAQKVRNGKPVFIGMREIEHEVGVEKKKLLLIFHHKHKVSFNYVFCLKSNSQKNAFLLGYSNTASTNRSDKNYIWAYNDLFIFINRPEGTTPPVKGRKHYAIKNNGTFK